MPGQMRFESISEKPMVGRGKWSAQYLRGNGSSGNGGFVQRCSARLRLMGWKPWDWSLVHVQKPDLSWKGTGGFLE